MEEIICSLHNYTKFSGINAYSYYDMAQSALECGIDAVLTADRNVIVTGRGGYFYKAGKRTLVLSGTESFDPLGSDSMRTISVDFSSKDAYERKRKSIKFSVYNRSAKNAFFAQFPFHKELFNTQDVLKRGFNPSVAEIHERLTGIDALWNDHQRPIIVAGNCSSYQIAPFQYQELFSSVLNHLLVPNGLTGDIKSDTNILYDALNTGRMFIAFDGLRPAKGFCFLSVGDNDEEPAYPGEQIILRDSVTLKIRLPSNCRCRLLRNGVLLREWINVASIPYTTTEPGVYRVECAIEHNRRFLDWIYTNPIYVIKG